MAQMKFDNHDVMERCDYVRNGHGLSLLVSHLQPWIVIYGSAQLDSTLATELRDRLSAWLDTGSLALDQEGGGP